MSSYVKFSEFNTDPVETNIDYDESMMNNMPIRENMNMPRNPPLYSDQYGHRQTSSPLNMNPYDNSYHTRNTNHNGYGLFNVSPPSFDTRNIYDVHTNNNNHHIPYIQKPPVTELFTMDNNKKLSTYEKQNNTTVESYTSGPTLTSNQEISCLDVNDHIMTCPLCSNYYKSYSYLYVGIIIILLIIILFLFKSLSEKK